MRVSNSAAEKQPYPRPAIEPNQVRTDASHASGDAPKQLDGSREAKLDRAEFSNSERHVSADERQREVLAKAIAAAAAQAEKDETADGIDTPSEPATKPAEGGSALDAVKGFFGNLFNTVKKALSDFVSWAGKQLNKLTNGFFETFKTDVVRNPEGADASRARARLKETEKAEAEALAKFTPKDREAYQAIASELDADPAAHLLLRELLLDGRLPGGKDLTDGASLLTHLSALATQPLAEGIDRRELLADILSHVDDPITVSQEQQNTCGPTTGQLILAMQEPAEYVRLAAGLASPEGKARLQNGETIAREQEWRDFDGDRRTVGNQLFQSALMEYANGHFDYNNVKDGRKVGIGNLAVHIPGLLPNEMTGLIESLTGQRHGVDLSLFSAKVSPEFEAALAKAGPGSEVPVLVNYNVNGSGVTSLSPHYLLVTGYDAETETVSISNPWGREEKMSLQELQRHLIASMPPKA